MFKVGEEIVCVEHFLGVFSDGGLNPGPQPIKGEHYIVDGSPNNGRSLYLKELNYINSRGFKAHFTSSKFRKLSDIWSEELLEEIVRQIEEEELILVNN